MRRRKQYNPLKQLHSVANQSFKNVTIGCIAGKGSCQLIDTRTFSPITLTNTSYSLITNLRHKWSVFIAVFGIDAQGQYYMKSEELSVVTPTFQSEMVATLNEHHAKLIKNFNKSQLISVGWLATPYLKEWDEAIAFNILSKLGALSFIRTPEGNIIEV